MKHIKAFEKNIEGIPVGNYIIIVDSTIIGETDAIFLDYIKKHIGYIWKKPGDNFSLVKFFNIPKEYQKYFCYTDEGLSKIGNSMLINDKNIRLATPEEIKKFELIQNATKYNI